MFVVVLGFLFEDYIDEYLFFVKIVVIGLIVGVVLMLFVDWVNKWKVVIDIFDCIFYK